MTASDEHAPGRHVGRGALIALLIGAAALGASAGFFDASRLHVHGDFGDQVGYITTARVWLETGQLESGLVYPAFVGDEGWRPYMPGHYALLVLSYMSFGYGVLATLAPNLIAYFVSILATYWLGVKLRGVTSGCVAAALFAVFPGNLTYAWTGMAEGTFVAAGLCGLALLISARPKRRAWLAPLCLALPFFFRETGALLVLPMAALVWSSTDPERRWRALFVCVVGSVLVCWGLQSWQLAAGKGSFPLTWIRDGRFNYRDATQAPVVLGLGGWIDALTTNAGRNLAESWRQLVQQPFDPAVIGYVLILIAWVATVVIGWRRRNVTALGAAALGLALLALLYTVYDVKNQKALRTTLFLLPVCLVGAVCALDLERFRSRRALGVGLGLLFVLGLASRAVARRAGEEMTFGDRFVGSAVSVLSKLHGDSPRLVAAPHEMIKAFAVERYPVRVSFHPANDETFRLLDQRYDVGTLVLPVGEKGTQISPETLRAAGLRRRPETITLQGGRNYEVWQKLP